MCAIVSQIGTGSIDKTAEVFFQMLRAYAKEEVESYRDQLAFGFTVHFNESHVGILINEEEFWECGEDYDRLRELALAKVRQRDEYIMEEGRKAIKENIRLGKKRVDITTLDESERS